MQKTVVVVDADKRQCRQLCALLGKRNYLATQKYSLSDLEKYIQGRSSEIIIMDIDTVPVDNRTIKKMVLKNPGNYFLCISADRFHPDLKDAICYHIYACINKPVDQDELFYLLESIYHDNVGPDNQPAV